MIRQHDIQVLAEGSGTYRVVLTSQRRVVVAIDLPDSALGPLHLVFAVSLQPALAATLGQGGLFDSFGRWTGLRGVAPGVQAQVVGDAAESTFDAASRAAPQVAAPAVDLAREAADAGAQLVAGTPLAPSSDRDKVEAASRIAMRARLGDVGAQRFLRSVGQAASAGNPDAQQTGNVLLAGSRIVAHVVDAPRAALDRSIPGAGGVMAALDPFARVDQMADALQRADFPRLQAVVEGGGKVADTAMRDAAEGIVRSYVQRYAQPRSTSSMARSTTPGAIDPVVLQLGPA